MPSMDLVQFPPSPPDSLSSSPPPLCKPQFSQPICHLKAQNKAKAAATVTVTEVATKNQNRTPHLPLELWTRIISYITDSRYLPRTWLHFRQVSHSFKAATELSFGDVHLRHTSLVFKEWDMGVTDKDGHVLWPKVVLGYKGLEKGSFGERAIFERVAVAEEDEEMKRVLLTLGAMTVAGDAEQQAAQGEEAEGQQEETNLFDYSMRRWREMVEPYAASPQSSTFPPHVLCVRHVVNDTPLPGIQVDFEKNRISVLWKPMLTHLYAEEEYVKWAKKIEHQHSPYRAKIASLMELVRDGEIPFEEVLSAVARMSRTSGDRVWGDVRRERLSRLAAGSTSNTTITTTTTTATEGGEVGGASRRRRSSKEEMEDTLKAELVQRMQEQVQWTVFDDDEDKDLEGSGSGEAEKGEGNFYDGMGLRFRGNTEMNPPCPDSANQSEQGQWSSEEGESWDEEDSYDDEEEGWGSD